MKAPTLIERILSARQVAAATSNRDDQVEELAYIAVLMQEFEADKPQLVFVDKHRNGAGYRKVRCQKCGKEFPAPIYDRVVSCFYCGIEEPIAAMDFELSERCGPLKKEALCS